MNKFDMSSRNVFQANGPLPLFVEHCVRKAAQVLGKPSQRRRTHNEDTWVIRPLKSEHDSDIDFELAS